MVNINHLTTTINLLQGNLRGGTSKTETGTEYFEFLDIPYAKPPVGELRFKCPQPAQPWDGERDASKIDLNHISCQYFYGEIKGSEDCLYLSVYVPKVSCHKYALLPVMVHIHGGGFNDGNGTNKNDFGPDFFLDNNVIIVSINYRLGVLGFLCLDIPEAAGNMGLKDQVEALRWIRNNIEAFGGNPNNVTLIGSSAGAAFVDYLTLAPTAQGLFHKAISQSGSSLNHWTLNHDMKTLIEKLLISLGFCGCSNDTSEVYKYLRNVSATILTKQSKKIIRSSCPEKLYFGFVPTIEKDFGDNSAIITKEPFQLFKEGSYNKVPVLKGFCDKEGYLTFCSKEGIKTLSQSKSFVDFWPQKIRDNDKKHYNSVFKELYLNDRNQKKDSDDIGIDFFGDFDVIAGVLLQGKILANDDVPVFMYEFSYDGSLNFVKYLHNIKKTGAAHADELGYLFKFPCDRIPTEQDIQTRNNLTTFWTNFAKTGSPTPKNNGLSIQWPTFSSNLPVYLNINTKLTIKSDYKPKTMAIFKEIYEKYNI